MQGKLSAPGAWPVGMVDRRTLLAIVGAMAAAPAPAAKPDILVSRSGSPRAVPSLAAAVERAREANGAAVRIGIEPGVYREKVRVDVPHLTIAATAPGVVLTYAAGSQHPSPEGRPWGTTGSATLTIAAPGITLRGLTIGNDHDFGREPMQAVALAVLASGEGARIERCRLESWQDTLLLQAGTLVRDCRIAGCIDFIFGGGAAWIDGCEIVSRHVPGAAGGFIAAPSTPASRPHGLIFARCRLTRGPGMPDDATYLGRPWRAGGNMALTGHAAFLRCWMDGHIRREGWAPMGFRDPAGVQRQLEPLDARLFEWRSRGPGAVIDPLRRILTDAQALAMTPVSTLGTWVAAKSDRAAAGRGLRP